MRWLAVAIAAVMLCGAAHASEEEEHSTKGTHIVPLNDANWQETPGLAESTSGESALCFSPAPCAPAHPLLMPAIVL
jgi:hypothetical protein